MDAEFPEVEISGIVSSIDLVGLASRHQIRVDCELLGTSTINSSTPWCPYRGECQPDCSPHHDVACSRLRISRPDTSVTWGHFTKIARRCTGWYPLTWLPPTAIIPNANSGSCIGQPMLDWLTDHAIPNGSMAGHSLHGILFGHQANLIRRPVRFLWCIRPYTNKNTN